MDWNTVGVFGALGLGVFSLFLNLSSKADERIEKLREESLSLREHKEFKDRVLADTKRLEDRVDVIEQTRPTTDELQAQIKAASLK